VDGEEEDVCVADGEGRASAWIDMNKERRRKRGNRHPRMLEMAVGWERAGIGGG
jgi:hypothetical protein